MSGRNLGRYRLEERAEERAGGVLRAEDTLLERQVNLLLVPPAAAAEPAQLERIRQQIERAAGFVHPNVASVYGMEESDGQPFVTLEPVAGRSLASVLAAGGLSLERVLEIALVLCDVLASGKDAGVVHGGLHPGDVVLGDDGAITVGGFGLHELRLAVEEELAEPSPAAAYRPPEAAQGLLPDHRADLFALGRLLREMLAAEGAEPLPEPGASGLQEVLECCLSADPAQRPQSAAELRAPLEELQRELLREEEPQAEDETPAKWRRIPARWGILAAGLLLLAIAGWALWRGLSRAETTAARVVEKAAPAAVERVDLAVMPFAGADGTAEALLAEGFGREVTRLLEADKGVSVVAAESAASVAATDATARQLGELLGVAHVLEGRFLWQREADLSRAEVAIRLVRASDEEVVWSETLEGFFGEIVELQTRVSVGVVGRLGAYEAYLNGVGRMAQGGSPKELRAAAADFEQAAILDPGLLLAHSRQVALQVALAEVGQSADSLAAARRALAAARNLDPRHPEVHRAAGELELASGGDPTVALEEFRAALERLPGHPDLLRAAALIDRRQGRWDEAIDGLARARPRDPLDLDLVTELVRTLIWKRRFDEAGEQIDGLAARLPEAVETALLRADLLLGDRGETGRARSALEGVPEAAHSDPRWQERMLRLDLYDGQYETALDRLSGLRLEEAEELIERSWIHRHMGRGRQAAAGFEKARDLLDDRLEANPDDPLLSVLLGQAYAGTGGARLGVRMGQRAVGQLPVTIDAVDGAELVERLARIYVLAGDAEHALDELAFLLEIPSPVTAAVLRLDPVWRPLRDSAGFQALLERFGS